MAHDHLENSTESVNIRNLKSVSKNLSCENWIRYKYGNTEKNSHHII